MNRQFTEQYLQMANKHTERCSTSSANREVQIKTAMRYYYILTRMTKIKNSDNPKAGKDAEKQSFG